MTKGDTFHQELILDLMFAVAVGIYATVLFSLGMIDRLANIADASHDMIGRQLEQENLPKRIRLPRKQMGNK